MRVIAGTLGGRQFKAPHGSKTHPMSEKVRGAIFNMLGDINNLTVLDAFAGSGALSFEAISRGALNAVAVDSDKNASRTIKENVRDLGLEKKIKVTKANISSWSDNNASLIFDLLLVDPPYDDLRLNLLDKLGRHLKESGVYVLAWPGHEQIPELKRMRVVEQKNYGDAQLAFYRRVS